MSGARGREVSRALGGPVFATLIVKLSATGKIEFLDVTPYPEEPSVAFVVDRALMWCTEKLIDAHDDFESAADVLARIPGNALGHVERLIMQEVAAVEQLQAQAFLAGRL